MTRTSVADLVEALRTTDPLRPPAGDAEDHLASAYRVLQARLDQEPTAAPVRRPSAWRRRLALVAALALPVALAVLAPAVLGGGHVLPGRSALVDSVEDTDTGRTCSSGSARAIPPSAADVRPWPTAVPTGWTLQAVDARITTTYGDCTTPALAATHTGTDGVVDGAVQITGPARNFPVFDGTAGPPVHDRVDGHPALAYPAPDLGGLLSYSWLVTDASGASWYATVDGYPLARARQLLSAADFDRGTLHWDSAAAPELTVIARHPRPAGETTTSQAWGLQFAVGGRTRDVSASSGDVQEYGRVGSRSLSVGGHLMVVQQDHGVPKWVTAQVLPGVVAVCTVDEDLDGDLADVTALLASFTDLPRDDPRLQELALPEVYPVAR